MSVNFREIKEKYTIEQVAGMLGLHLNREGDYLRGECPACEGSADRGLSIHTGWNTFKCFCTGSTGSAIDLVSHVKKLPITQAARFINDSRVAGDIGEASYAPPEPTTVKATDPSKGFPPEVCKAVGITYAKAKELPEYIEVTWKKPASIPIRDKQGNLVGTMIVSSAMLPRKWGAA